MSQSGVTAISGPECRTWVTGVKRRSVGLVCSTGEFNGAKGQHRKGQAVLQSCQQLLARQATGTLLVHSHSEKLVWPVVFISREGRAGIYDWLPGRHQKGNAPTDAQQQQWQYNPNLIYENGTEDRNTPGQSPSLPHLGVLHRLLLPLQADLAHAAAQRKVGGVGELAGSIAPHRQLLGTLRSACVGGVVAVGGGGGEGLLGSRLLFSPAYQDFGSSILACLPQLGPRPWAHLHGHISAGTSGGDGRHIQLLRRARKRRHRQRVVVQACATRRGWVKYW